MGTIYFSGNPAALFWPGRAIGTHAVDFDRVLDVGTLPRNYFRPASRAVGLPEMRVHDLRHPVTSFWLAAGFMPYQVSRWLRYASVTTTDCIYAPLCPKDYTEHVTRFDAFVAGP